MRRALAVVGVVAVVWACGSSDDSESPGTGGAAGAAGTGGQGGSGGSTGGASATGGGGSGGSSGVAGSDASAGAAGQDASDGAAGADASDGDAAFTAASCFEKQFVNSTSSFGLDYDQFNPVIGTHCKGTNQQHIKGVQKVVFLGDSVTVGTPPTNFLPSNVYRAILATKLAQLFNLKPPGFGWGAADPFNGVALPKESGDFISCAKWGARTDDLMKDNNQIEDCIPADKRHLHHLVIMTVGGNDIAAITQDGGGTSPKKTIAQLWQDTQAFVKNLRDAVEWLKNPTNVPGGVDVVFGNNYEFTDGTGEVTSCTTAGLGGIEPWQDKKAQADMVIWANEQYMKIAVDTKSDMIFMLESFCGHGFKRDDPTAPCYRGPNQALWFDPTCIHPNVEGNVALADLFYETIAE